METPKLIQNTEALSNTIKDLELSLMKKEVRRSRNALDKLITEDFIEFGTSGNKYTKTDILERLPNTVENFQYVMSDFSTEIISENLIIANFKTEKVMEDGEKIISLRSSHWRKENNNWQIFFSRSKKN